MNVNARMTLLEEMALKAEYGKERPEAEEQAIENHLEPVRAIPKSLDLKRVNRSLRRVEALIDD